jgi:hypothetical protein
MYRSTLPKSENQWGKEKGVEGELLALAKLRFFEVSKFGAAVREFCRYLVKTCRMGSGPDASGKNITLQARRRYMMKRAKCNWTSRVKLDNINGV